VIHYSNNSTGVATDDLWPCASWGMPKRCARTYALTGEFGWLARLAVVRLKPPHDAGKTSTFVIRPASADGIGPDFIPFFRWGAGRSGMMDLEGAVFSRKLSPMSRYLTLSEPSSLEIASLIPLILARTGSADGAARGKTASSKIFGVGQLGVNRRHVGLDAGDHVVGRGAVLFFGADHHDDGLGVQPSSFAVIDAIKDCRCGPRRCQVWGIVFFVVGFPSFATAAGQPSVMESR